MGNRIGVIMKIEKEDIIFILIGIIIGILIIFLGIYIGNKVYEYHCDHIPITQAWEDNQCKEYFKRTMEDKYEK